MVSWGFEKPRATWFKGSKLLSRQIENPWKSASAETFVCLLPFGSATFVWHETHLVFRATDLFKPPQRNKKKKQCLTQYDFSFCRATHVLFISLVKFHLCSCLLKVRVIKAWALCPYCSARAQAPIVSMTHAGLLERLQPNAKEEKGGRIWALAERITELLVVMSGALMTFLCSIGHIFHCTILHKPYLIVYMMADKDKIHKDELYCYFRL